MKKIIAIGGGELAKLQTLRIDQEIVRLAQKKRPRALFIPTASGDSEDYVETFRFVYGHKLDCHCDVLMLLRDRPSKTQMRQQILSADLIYVGGGNTLRMMRLWRRLGVDKLLATAWRKGIVLSGMSAGANCWFNGGCSDSMKFANSKQWRYIRVRGLGFIDVIACPHYHSEQREDAFDSMILKFGGIGLAVDDNCALEVVGDSYRVITSKQSAKAYRLFRRRGEVVRERIRERTQFTLLEELLPS